MLNQQLNKALHFGLRAYQMGSWFESLVKVCTSRGGGSTDKREAMEWLNLSRKAEHSDAEEIPRSLGQEKPEEFTIIDVAPRQGDVGCKQVNRSLATEEWVLLSKPSDSAPKNLPKSESSVRELIKAFEASHGSPVFPKFTSQAEYPAHPTTPTEASEPVNFPRVPEPPVPPSQLAITLDDVIEAELRKLRASRGDRRVRNPSYVLNGVIMEMGWRRRARTGSSNNYIDRPFRSLQSKN
jgi:hypothetical protein